MFVLGKNNSTNASGWTTDPKRLIVSSTTVSSKRSKLLSERKRTAMDEQNDDQLIEPTPSTKKKKISANSTAIGKKRKLSGWERKKVKDSEAWEEEKKKYQRLDNFFCTSSSSLDQGSIETQPNKVQEFRQPSNESHTVNEMNDNAENLCNNSAESHQAHERCLDLNPPMNEQQPEVTPLPRACEAEVPEVDVLENQTHDQNVSVESRSLKSIINTEINYPTDPHLFRERAVTPELIRALLEFGPCQPGLTDDFRDFPKDENGRHFSSSWYKRKTLKGSKGEREYKRQWLVYSPRADSMFCFACWLFANRSDSWSNPKTGCKAFTKGVHKIENHEKSIAHKNAKKELFWTNFRLFKDKTVVANLMAAERKEIEKNRTILKRITDVVLYLAKQNIAFRGHREHGGLCSPDINEGIFLELIKLLAKHDSVLEQHLLQSDRNATYLSAEIQNELIQSLAAEVKSKITAEIKHAKYYAVIVDSTIDISRTDQFSLSLRYVTENGDTVERFVQFLELPSASAEMFYKLLCSALLELDIPIEMCYGQSYDGANTMSGELSGLQKRVKEVAPFALFTHCCAHNLNLVLIDAVNSNVQVKLFFGTLESVYAYFSGSLPRLTILKKEQRKSMKKFSLTLKRLSDTRWASRKAAVESVLQNLPALVTALKKIAAGQLKSCTPKQMAEATGILATLRTYEFLVLILFWKQLLNKAFQLSSYLQRSAIDMVTAASFIKSFELYLAEFRSSYDAKLKELEEEATALAKKFTITSTYKQQRMRKKKRHHEELAQDEAPSDARKKFICETFLVSLDSVVNSTSSRFEKFKDMATKFIGLDPKHFEDDDNLSTIECLADEYPQDIDCKDELVQEFSSFKDLCREMLGSKYSSHNELTINSVLKFLIANDLCVIYPNLSSMYRIYMTLPISSAAAERSFSRLKLVKSYLRSTMAEERLSGLALLSIERFMANSIDHENVIDNFARMKPRRKKLL